MKKGQHDILLVKKTHHEYHKVKRFEAGVVLEGWMVKAIRAGRISVANSVYVRPQHGELFVFGLHIKPLETTNTFSTPNPDPTIKLLLKRREIDAMIGGEQRDGHTIVMPRLYWDRHLIKAELWLAKGKNQQDKRQSIKNREGDRATQRALKGAMKS